MGFIEGDHFDDEQCLALLRRARFGRLSVSLRAVSVVVPVRYVLDGEVLLFAPGVEELAQALNRGVATLQADGFEEDSGQRWSVFVVGVAQRVENAASIGTETRSPSLAPDAALGDPVGLFRLVPEILSGR